MGRATPRVLAWLLVLALLVAALPADLRPTTAASRTSSGPVTSHPRLWLTADDLPRLRGWATDANPLWQDGLAVLAADRTAEMDEGKVPGGDGGSYLYEEYAVENYAELFAFLSLVHPDATTRQDYAQRARTVLMAALDQAAKGQADEETPFRQPDFATNDRSRWSGEAWALTVDWIYPMLTAQDKATIRRVFLRWCEEIVQTGYHRPGYDDPSLIGKTDDLALLADPGAVRWAGNNYFTGNMRNLGLMALALDPADDPGGELHAYLKIAIGAHLYMVDHLFRTDAAGGLGPEGFEYSPQAVGYVAQFLLALHTAGQDDPATWGPQVRFDGNPFWDEVVPAYLHSLSPRTVIVPGQEYRGPVYQPAWYGDGQTYWAPDPMELFGPLGRYDDLTGNDQRLAAIRWIETETAPGGTAALATRVADAEDHHNAILSFLLFDPAAPAPTDPRPNLPLFHFAPGIGRLLARTSWDADATWFTYTLGWKLIDHQHGDGNQFEFYRNGEWLTKGLVGYGSNFGPDVAPGEAYSFPSSEYHNTLALENDAPQYNDPTDPTHEVWRRGSQWPQDAQGDPAILALDVEPGYVYALGDATNLYDSTYQGSTDILHASRSVVWLAPDVIVVYDRAASKTAGRFKRFRLNLPASGTVDGTRTMMTTASGQQLVVDTLQPSGVTPVVQPLDVQVDVMATGEPMRYRLLVEAPGGPKETRFLNVLQAADPGATVGPAVAIASDDGAFTGAVVGTTAVLFPVDLGAEIDEVRYTVPAGTSTQLITGLTPGAGYDVTTTAAQDGIDVAVTAGTAYRADDAGVLLIGSLPDVLGASSFTVTNAPAPASAVATPEATEEATPGATPAAEEPTAQPAASPATVGGAAATGSGEIVFNVPDGHVYRVAARTGASPEDLSLALDAEWPAATPVPAASPDDWIAIAPDGTWLLLGTERFDPDCAGWACLAVVRADLSSGEVVRTADGVVHPDGPGAVAAGGGLIVYPDDGGPHALDLWAVSRQGNGWSAPALLTGASTSQYNDQPSISTDGARVVFDCGDATYATTGTAICEVGTDGSGFRVVITAADAPPGLAQTGAVHHAAYAPDGGMIFEADWTGDAIWRLPPGASVPDPVGVAFTNDNAPCALPDGRIASLWLDRPGGSGSHEIKVMTLDGSAYAMLVTDLDVEDIGCGG